jgi:hypothetical protein
MDLSLLKPYHGYQSSFIPLSSGYYLYVASWDSTPTSFPSFSNIWVITPEDRRMLFADPPASSVIVCIYHQFHEVYPASISLDWDAEHHLVIRCASLDGEHEVNVDLRLGETLASRLLAALASGQPNHFMLSRPVVAVSEFLVNLLAAKGGSTMFGETETGQPFYLGSADQVMLVRSGSAEMNGKDLGHVSSPTWPIEFGDGGPTTQPLLRLGTLFIPYKEGMVGRT